MTNTKKNKTKKEQFTSIFMVISAILFSASLVFTIYSIISMSSRHVITDVDTKTRELTLTSDKNIPVINIELKINTKEFGTKTENISVKELKAYETKKIVPKTQLLSSKNVTIEEIRCSGTITPFESSMFFIMKITGVAAIISFTITLIFGYKR